MAARPATDSCYSIFEIGSELSVRIIARMRLFESVKASNPCLKAIMYSPDKARWFSGITGCEVELLGG
jgi:hypothetical protein